MEHKLSEGAHPSAHSSCSNSGNNSPTHPKNVNQEPKARNIIIALPPLNEQPPNSSRMNLCTTHDFSDPTHQSVHSIIPNKPITKKQSPKISTSNSITLNTLKT